MDQPIARPPRERRTTRVDVLTAVVGASLLAWLIVLWRMRGMDAGPGTDLGSATWYLGIWVTMMAAMMLPSVAPMVSLVARLEARSEHPALSTSLFVVGYLAAWTAYGVVAYVLFRLVRATDLGFVAWDRAGPALAGGAIVLAGLYQLTPLKQVCLSHCRTPLGFLVRHWHDGPLGALRMGADHGAWCVGCCWALMLVLFAVGVMSITWMVVVALVVFAEKVLPVGERIAQGVAVALVALGVWVAVAPGSVPGLTEPGGTSKMEQMLPAPAPLA